MRFRTGLAGVALATAAMLGLTACGGGSDEISLTGAQTALSVEAQALSAMGFDGGDLLAAGPLEEPAANPSSSAAADPSGDKAGKDGDRRGHRRARVMLRRNMLHGEAVVKTKDGTTKTVAVQRGTITAIDSTSITVKSTDGYTQKWTLGSPLRVIEHRTTIQPSQLAVGRAIGIAGEKSGDTSTAHLVVVAKEG